MGNFFKNFGKGILYILAIPVLAVALVLYGVAAVFVFLFLAVKGLVLFFTGRSLYEDLPEDIEAKRRIEKEHYATGSGTTIVSTGSLIESVETESPNTDDPFYVPEYLKPAEEQEVESEPATEQQEEQVEQQPVEEPPVIEQNTNQSIYEMLTNDEETPLPNPEPAPVEMEEEVITVEKQPQNSVILDINEIEDEDEEEHSGIDIDYQ